MPKKPKKSREEKSAEEFFPVKPEKVLLTIEKPHKPLDVMHLIKEQKPRKTTLRKTVKKARKKTIKKRAVKKTKNFEVKKISLKKTGYELIITEKPQAALKISSALGKSVKKTIGKVPYYEVDRKGKKIIVACAVGHLFTLTQKTTGAKVPTFDITWVPNYYVRKQDFSKRYYDVILKLVKNAGSLTVATDYDVEGEVIGLNIVRFIAGQEDASRMKFSTLTEKEIDEAYEKKLSHIDWGQAIAGETRHILDWLYGINLSRALMNAIKTTGRFRIMSIGRVQGPALNLIVKKEKEIQSFEPKPYWQIFITLENPKIELIHNKDIFKKEELKKFENLIGKTGEAETKKTQKKIPPNPPFNLTTLQTESYRLFNIAPAKTLQAAQNLYLAGLISYPRTSSQKLPPSIGYKEILEKLSKEHKVENLITRKNPIEGKKSDPAHPSIYPTGEKSGLDTQGENEKKIYNLIVRRFLSLFMDDAIIDNKTIRVKIEELIFSKKGSEIKKKSWLEIYPVKIKEENIPDVNGEVKIDDSRIEEKETQPPRRYSPASIISELEKKNLGTKATRSSILETLYDRNYVQDQKIRATPLGISLIDTLEKHSPIIIDENLTREFEKDTESLQKKEEKLESLKKKESRVIEKAEKTITTIAKQFEEKKEKIGEELLGANEKLREQQREENKLQTICPVCKKGNLAVSYSRKTRRYFIACNQYPECKTTYSLPPNGMIKKSDDFCEECNFQKTTLLKKGSRPWTFCFNRECPTNKERIEAYRKKQEELEKENFKNQ